MQEINNDKKVAIITGGAAGIGKACTLRFAEEGMRVVIGDISEDVGIRTQDLIRDQGGEAQFVPGSIADKEVCQELADTALKNYGRIEILVANAAAHTASADPVAILSVCLFGQL